MDAILDYKGDHPDYYELLGCAPSSSMEQILREFKAKALVCHPDKRGDANSDEFQLLQEAKRVLTDPVQRKAYDTWKNAGIAMSFAQFQNLSKSAHTSMHWVNTKQTKPMLESSETSEPKDVKWERESPSEMLRRFRTYEI